MQEHAAIPNFVSVVAIALGCVDLVRGFIHTIVLEFAALNIAGFDLSTPLAGDLLQLMGAFGISNYLTGIMLILIGWRARPLALAMLGIIPAAYLVGILGIKANSTCRGRKCTSVRQPWEVTPSLAAATGSRGADRPTQGVRQPSYPVPGHLVAPANMECSA